MLTLNVVSFEHANKKINIFTSTFTLATKHKFQSVVAAALAYTWQKEHKACFPFTKFSYIKYNYIHAWQDLQPQKWTIIIIYHCHCPTTVRHHTRAEKDSQCTSSIHLKILPQLHHQWLYDQLSNLHIWLGFWSNSQTGHIEGKPVKWRGWTFSKIYTYQYIHGNTSNNLLPVCNEENHSS